MSLAELPPLREALERHDLMARKSFGQHFLLDLNVTRKIARLAQVGDGDTVVEVGPGPGGLTRALLETGARVVAIEKDSRFLPLLGEVAEVADGRLVLVEGDALKVDAGQAAGGAAHVVSNLPYNVGTQLLINWLTGPFRPLSMTLMFQKEVADRIVAQSDDDAYGRLAVIAQTLCEARTVMDLPAKAFTPPPKVASAVVRLVPKVEPPPPPVIAALERVTAAAFGQRRKMLRSSLKALGGAELCERAGVSPDARAEVIDLAGFLALAQASLEPLAH
jgi:16S rRNA (adenine1518-N6/adenine1519-N6)-dimethyltransferase